MFEGAFTKRISLIALRCAHLKELLKLCRITSQDMSALIRHTQLLFIHQSCNTNWSSEWFMQQQHLLTGRGHYRDLCIWPVILMYHCMFLFGQRSHVSNCRFFHRPNTGILVWMRWKEQLQIKKGRSSRDSSESGTKQFSVETRLQPPASGEQVRQGSLIRMVQKLFCNRYPHIIVSKAWHVIYFKCRCNASRPRTVLRFYQVCCWTEWVGLITEAAAAAHRHQTPTGPTVTYSCALTIRSSARCQPAVVGKHYYKLSIDILVNNQRLLNS